MTDNELLLAISDMMDKKLEHITKDVQEMKKDINNIKTRTSNLENETKSIQLTLENETKSIQLTLKNEIKSIQLTLENEIKNIQLTLENEIKPPLNNIQACYTSTFDRYKNSVEDYEDIKQDISIMKKVIQEHSQKLQNIS